MKSLTSTRAKSRHSTLQPLELSLSDTIPKWFGLCQIKSPAVYQSVKILQLLARHLGKLLLFAIISQQEMLLINQFTSLEQDAQLVGQVSLAVQHIMVN